MINALKMLDAQGTTMGVLSDSAAGAVTQATESPTLDIAEPVTLLHAKEHLRVTAPDEDAYISGLITAARAMAEGRLNRTIVQRPRVARFVAWGAPQNWRFVPGYYAGSVVRGEMRLLKPPVISVDSVEYLDANGAEATLDTDRYYLVPANEDELPRVELVVDSTPLPVLAPGRRDLVRVYYTAGYPVGEVPAPIVQWILLALGTMYANRESVVNGVTSVPLADDFMKWLLQPYMVYE